jgi:hypothetical protein
MHDEAIGTRLAKTPNFIFGSAPTGRRFSGACGLARATTGATCRAFGKRRRVAAFQIPHSAILSAYSRIEKFVL